MFASSRSVLAEESNFSHEAGLTAIALNASDKHIKNEETASADLWLYWKMPSGRWTLYLEGNTTPRTDGVSTLLYERHAPNLRLGAGLGYAHIRLSSHSNLNSSSALHDSEVNVFGLR